MQAAVNPAPIDVLILSNGPGEVLTWVRPVVQALRSQLGQDTAQVRISVILSPCPHASGRECDLVAGMQGVDRVQDPEAFWSFVRSGKTAQVWDWRRKGVVLFLGGDQFFAVLIGKRLGYRIVTYAEWSARWLRWIDACGAARPQVMQGVAQRFQSKVHWVGDLIAEAQVINADEASVLQQLNLSPDVELVSLLPGSKAAKLCLGVPLGLAIADRLQQIRPQVQMVITVAPTLTLTDLSRFADPQTNPYFEAVEGSRAKLCQPDSGLPYLQTEQGTRVLLWTQVPAYDALAASRLCITTVGANTAELTALAVPMVVLLPTQQLDIMRAWDGIPGLLANLPFLGSGFAKLINAWVLRQGLGLRAWPNIWAGREIVPEWVGHLRPDTVGDRIAALLADPSALHHIQSELQHIRSQPGAAQRFASLVHSVLPADLTQPGMHTPPPVSLNSEKP
ncbi:MAG TPA: lipid-A-disaccharide synthase [Stenomitos sp.]